MVKIFLIIFLALSSNIVFANDSLSQDEIDLKLSFLPAGPFESYDLDENATNPDILLTHEQVDVILEMCQNTSVKLNKWVLKYINQSSFIYEGSVNISCFR